MILLPPPSKTLFTVSMVISLTVLKAPGLGKHACGYLWKAFPEHSLEGDHEPSVWAALSHRPEAWREGENDSTLERADILTFCFPYVTKENAVSHSHMFLLP